MVAHCLVPGSGAIPLPTNWSLADLQHFLGDIPAKRIRLFPSPGTATEADLLWAMDHEDRICELIDGVLVEKVGNVFESALAAYLISLIYRHMGANEIGIMSGPGGPLRFSPSRIRIPDVAFTLWDRFPNRLLPRDEVFSIVPDLTVEILSESNTRGEMELKRDEYLEAGVQLIWYIDPHARTATVYSSDGVEQHFDEHGILSGGIVLPGFELALQPFFDHFPVEPA